MIKLGLYKNSKKTMKFLPIFWLNINFNNNKFINTYLKKFIKNNYPFKNL